MLPLSVILSYLLCSYLETLVLMQPGYTHMTLQMKHNIVFNKWSWNLGNLSQASSQAGKSIKQWGQKGLETHRDYDYQNSKKVWQPNKKTNSKPT